MTPEGRIKVLTITTSGLSHREGISTVILDYYIRLDKAKYDLHLVAAGEYEEGLVQAFQDAGVSIRYLPSRKKKASAYFRSFIKLCRQERYDAVYIHGSSAIMCLELIIARCFGCRNRISHSHNTTCSHRTADRVLRPIFYRVITHALACGHDAGVWLYGKRPFNVITNGRDPQRYAFNQEVRDQMRTQLDLTAESIAVGHVGSFNEQKNQAFLIEIFHQFRQMVPAAKLFLFGDGPKRAEVMKHAAEFGVECDVVFTGNIQSIPAMLQAMDVMVLPSFHEGLPLVVIEWQMAGLPCIVSDRVTKECTFTDLVTYKGLDRQAQEWADDILRVSAVDRREESEKAIAAAGEKGFDINREVDQLDQILCNGVPPCRPMKG